MSSYGYILSPTGELLEADPAELEAAELAQEDYDRFRTGLTFGDVRRMLAVEQRRVRRDTGGYMFVSRSTVLGRWKELKEAMFAGDPPPPMDVKCEECGEVVELEAICADCGDCMDCCSCSFTPQDDFWRENPWGGNSWRLRL